ncbi:MAG: hypothetical protein OEQ39_03955 [Gammaproteobacteria bacterium]|nr:hypothetical protein [Gammaproteobacteria bacterium]MDH3468799.1 hypothetical protein [Gammaproteobacteria bacterium]
MPDKLTLRADNLYRIVIANPSQHTHIIAVLNLSGQVLTTDVRRYSVNRSVAPDPSNAGLGPSSLTPLPGKAFAMQLAPMQTAEWYLKPTMEGTFKIRCAMPEHALAGAWKRRSRFYRPTPPLRSRTVDPSTQSGPPLLRDRWPDKLGDLARILHEGFGVQGNSG